MFIIQVREVAAALLLYEKLHYRNELGMHQFRVCMLCASKV